MAAFPRRPRLGNTSSPAARGAVLTLAVVVLVISLEWMAWRQYHSHALRLAAADFSRIADQATLSLMQQTMQYRNALFALRATSLASERFDADEFARYVRALAIEQTLPGLRAFAFNRAIAEDGRAAYVQRIRSEFAATDPVYTRFDIYPDGLREHYHVVEMIQPPSGNQRSLGYDLNTSGVRRATIEYALRNGFGATPPIQLQQAPGVLAVLILAPLRDPRAPAGDDTVAASFLVNDMVGAAISPALRRQFHLTIIDLGAIDADSDSPAALYMDPAPAADDARSAVREESFGGRRWQLRFQPTQPVSRPLADGILFALFALGALLAGTVSHLAQNHSRRVVRHQALARLGSDCVMELDANGLVRSADAAAQRITGRLAEHWQGRTLWHTVIEEDAEQVENAVRRCIDRHEPAVIECRVNADGGEGGPPRWIAARLANHLDHPYLGCVLAQISNIDGRKAAEAEVQRLAFYDALTSLPNRRLLEARADLTFSAARRHNGRAAVLVLDLDGFKDINDSAGHAVGDEVLAQVATRLRHSVRDSDTVARLGGDEFVILLGEPAGEADVRAASVRLAHALSVPLPAAGHNWLVTASIGITMYPDHGERFADLLGAADAAMYRSKRAGQGLSTMATSRAG